MKTKQNVQKAQSRAPKTLSQLHRIIGQLQAVERMIGQKKEEKQVLMLMDAGINSMKSLRSSFIKESIRGKLTKELDEVLSLY